MRGTTRRQTIGRLAAIIAACAVAGSIGVAATLWNGTPRRLRILVPDRLIGGAWQTPAALRHLIEGERIRTIVTLTAINRDDPKYLGQAEVVRETGVDWIIIPMRGSTATLEQMAQAADLLADPVRQPVYFHCVAGHHRTSLAHAAYLIRHAGYSAQRAWKVVSRLPWARPGAPADEKDRALIVAFAGAQSSISPDPSPGELQAAHVASP